MDDTVLFWSLYLYFFNGRDRPVTPWGKCSTREKPLYKLWQRTDCMGTDPVCELSVSGRKVQRMWGADPLKVFLDRTCRWSSFYRLRDQIWLWQIRRSIAKRRSDFCIFRNITCGSPD